jgi:RNA polymerase sigma factor (sigma-70 family)
MEHVSADPLPFDTNAPAAGQARLEDFLARHKGLIQRVVRHVGGRRVELLREDIEQEVLISLWRRLGREQPLDLTPSYVYKAALRETVRSLRREGSRGGQSATFQGDWPGSANEPFADVSHRECVEALEKSLAELPDDRQRAARLHLQGFRVEEIMTMCGWPYQRARNLVARAMADLRVALRERGIRD